MQMNDIFKIICVDDENNYVRAVVQADVSTELTLIPTANKTCLSYSIECKLNSFKFRFFKKSKSHGGS